MPFYRLKRGVNVRRSSVSPQQAAPGAAPVATTLAKRRILVPSTANIRTQAPISSVGIVPTSILPGSCLSQAPVCDPLFEYTRMFFYNIHDLLRASRVSGTTVGTAERIRRREPSFPIGLCDVPDAVTRSPASRLGPRTRVLGRIDCPIRLSYRFVLSFDWQFRQSGPEPRELEAVRGQDEITQRRTHDERRNPTPQGYAARSTGGWL